MKKLLLIVAGAIAFGNSSIAQCDQGLVHFLCYHSLGMTVEVRNESDFIIYQNIITSYNNSTFYAFELSLPDGCYTFNGANDPDDYYIINVRGVDTNGTSQFYHYGGGDSYSFSVGGYGGCTDPNAVNYLPEACLSFNGEQFFCNYDQANSFVTIEICDGINGKIDVGYTINSPCSGSNAGYGSSWVDGGHTIHQHVIPPGVWEISFYDYGPPYSFTYTIRVDGNIVATGSDIPDPVSLTIGGGNTYGCNDAYACNYDPDATCNDDSCVFGDPCCNGPGAHFQVTFNDPDDDYEEICFDLYDENGFYVAGECVYEAYGETELYLCVPSGCYLGLQVWDITDNTEWYLLDPYGNTIASGVGSGITYDVCLSGGSSPGCTDPLACNYDATAITDDGSCAFPSITLSSTNDGDGIAEAMLYYFIDNYTQEQVTASAQLLEGQTVNVCLYPSYFTIILTPTVGEMQWQLSPVTGIGTLTGTSTQLYSFFTTNGALILGCTDPTAENFENWASIDAGTCTYPPEPGDYTDDGAVNTSDLLILLSEMGCNVSCDTDLTNDGVTNTSDLLVFLSVFGT